MTNLIVEVSKYLMILLMAIYTYANFRFFSFPDLERKRKVCARQNRAMFLLHFLAYLVMYLKTEDETLSRMLLVFYIGQVVFFLLYIYICLLYTSTKEVADFALDIMDVDKMGLDQNDRNILLMIIEKFSGGPVGLDTLAAALGEDAGTLEDAYEPYLLMNGLINRTPRGRMATENAYRHLGLEMK